MFCPSRLVLARKRRGFTQKFLAEQIGIESRNIVSYEKGEQIPSAKTLQGISEALKFPLMFFESDDIELVNSNSASFRAFTKLTAGQRDSALAGGTIGVLFQEWIDKEFNLPDVSIPNLRGYDPESAAETVRAEWGLGNKPIKNMIHLLESKGVRIFSLTKESQNVDAFCFWRTKTPFIFINITKSPERCRFDAAHELAHLVLHRHGIAHGKEIEKEADRFAAAFLMPKDSIIALNAFSATLDSVVDLKKRWSVSAMALIHRLNSLGIISDWHYRQLCIQASKKGYRKAEPNGIAPESSQVLSKIIKNLHGEGLSIKKVANELNLSSVELNDLLFGLVATPLDGNGKRSESPAVRPNLRLV
ncbi:MAG: XRE family transcriptional regulator [Bdellovibrionales bacterium]|nr:XRE family transcriptional regulator [Bdellovibrionales bacterium]